MIVTDSPLPVNILIYPVTSFPGLSRPISQKHHETNIISRFQFSVSSDAENENFICSNVPNKVDLSHGGNSNLRSNYRENNIEERIRNLFPEGTVWRRRNPFN